MNVMTSSGAPDERRVSPRVAINEFVELERDGLEDPARALALNVSNSGIAVAHCLLGDVGDRVSCRLLFTPREPVALDCRIVWVRPASDDVPAAMGLCFEEITETRTAKLDRLVRHIRATIGGEPVVGMPIDPFCETGTWSDEEIEEIEARISETDAEQLDGGDTPRDQYTHWVAPLPQPGRPYKTGPSWWLVLLLLATTIALSLALFFGLV